LRAALCISLIPNPRTTAGKQENDATSHTASQSQPQVSTIDSLAAMAAELDEWVELLRPYFPNENRNQLLVRAMYFRPLCYASGRWPTGGEIDRLRLQWMNSKEQEINRTGKPMLVLDIQPMPADTNGSAQPENT
jgi:hypothetical protein